MGCVHVYCVLLWNRREYLEMSAGNKRDPASDQLKEWYEENKVRNLLPVSPCLRLYCFSILPRPGTANGHERRQQLNKF